jgi:flagellar hook protein FlgE
MSILNSLYSGVSGLRANGRGMSIISDNISNVNNVGFKRARGNFQDMMSMTVLGIGNISQIGMGTSLLNVQQMFQQGSLENSTNATDMAINGGGFFVVKGTVNGVSGNFFTRAGQFMFDKDGYLVNQQGLKVQGYGVDATDENGTITTGVGDIRVTSSQIQPKATTTMEINANLNSDATASGPFDATSYQTAMATSNFHTVQTVYDSLGNAHDVTLYFTKTGANTWAFNVVGSGDEVSGGTAGTPSVLGTGTATFDTSGNLTAVTGNSFTTTFNGASSQTVTMDLGTPGSSNLDEIGLTQFSSDSTVHFASQNGYATGNLRYINVTEDGLITGAYSNGEVLNLGKVALANFVANEGLKKLGGNLYGNTSKSGEPLIGEANTGPRGTIQGNSLEQSNVDLAEEFVNMITTQKGFDANSKSIQTTDRMLDTIITLKR